MRLSDFDDWARQHHGLITLRASGLTIDAWRRAVRAGSLIEVHRHVARLPGTPTHQQQEIHAAVLATGGLAMASHQSAAVLWNLIEPTDALTHLTVPERNRRPRLAGVVVHRPTDRQQLTPQRRHGIRCTDPLRTLCDLGADDPSLVEPAVGAALSRRLLDLDALTAAVVQHSRRGRPGIPALRAAIDAWAIDHRPADSVLEVVFVELVRRHRLPPITFHERIAGWEVDFRFAGTAVLVECDGWSTHGLDRDQFERDRRKDNDLANAGWQVLRFSYRSIVNDPSGTAHRIRRALERWQHLDVPAAP
jgi:very-short-patch-repair endonuclease